MMLAMRMLSWMRLLMILVKSECLVCKVCVRVVKDGIVGEVATRRGWVGDQNLSNAVACKQGKRNGHCARSCLHERDPFASEAKMTHSKRAHA